MFDNIKKGLYFSKMHLLLKKGVEEGDIVPFDDEFYEKMNHTYINCLPVSIHMKYLKLLVAPGKCYDRSLFMFFCFPNLSLVRGDHKVLELRYGKKNAGHGWIEMDGYCYDPSLLLRFKKETYYEIYKPYNVSKIITEEYKNCYDSNQQFYEDIVRDFQPNGRKRNDLCIIIPLVQGIAEMGIDEDFKKDLNEYLRQFSMMKDKFMKK